MKETSKNSRQLKASEWFLRHKADMLGYARSCFSDEVDVNRQLQLKINHSLRVVDLISVIISEERAFQDDILSKAVLLAALYHDIGRFWQYRTYQTFADSLSCDHGYAGVRICKQHLFFREELPGIRKVVLACIALHNKRQVSSVLPSRLRQVLNAVRDADKLDILYILHRELMPGKKADPSIVMHLQNEPGCYTPSVLSAFNRGESALYAAMRYYNDFRLVLCSWLPDFFYPASHRIVAEEGLLMAVADSLEGIEEVKKQVKEKLQEQLWEVK